MEHRKELRKVLLTNLSQTELMEPTTIMQVKKLPELRPILRSAPRMQPIEGLQLRGRFPIDFFDTSMKKVRESCARRGSKSIEQNFAKKLIFEGQKCVRHKTEQSPDAYQTPTFHPKHNDDPTNPFRQYKQNEPSERFLVRSNTHQQTRLPSLSTISPTVELPIRNGFRVRKVL